MHFSQTTPVCVVVAACSLAAAETVTLTAAADATLYETSLEAPLANGSGDGIFCGNTGSGAARRALILFDVSSIPAGATVMEATLTLRLSRTISGDQACTVHRVTSAWSEGPSHPFGEEGGGLPAVIGDATWHHGTYDTVVWNTPGGDFIAAGSASTAVGLTLADYEWTSAGLAADVQAWVDGTASNHGWIVTGNESALVTAKRFNSRNDPLGPPRLTVTFEAPATCVCERDGAAGVDVFDLLAYLDLWFAGDAAADLDGMAGVDVFDLLAFLDCWFGASAGGACP